MEAIETFRTPPYRHNCAQAIAYHWQHLYSYGNIVEMYAPYKGGRAPQGLCGALFAAMEACPKHATQIANEFESICGAAKCIDIKNMSKTSCETCVMVADKLVSKYS